MYHRNAFKLIKSTSYLNRISYAKSPNFSRLLSTSVQMRNFLPISNKCYVTKVNTNIKTEIGLRKLSTEATDKTVPIAVYEEIKDLPNHPEIMLIDVREPSELQETGTIPTSVNIPLGDVVTALSLSDRQFKAKYNRNKPNYSDQIIFNCRVGIRSVNAALAAEKLGYTNVRNYKGSWIDYAEHEGLPK